MSRDCICSGNEAAANLPRPLTVMGTPVGKSMTEMEQIGEIDTYGRFSSMQEEELAAQ